MKYQMTIYCADQEQNNMMSTLGIRPANKWFVQMYDTECESKTPINDSYFQNIINQSKKSREFSGFWIPAIKFLDYIYHDPSVDIISDGKKNIYLKQNRIFTPTVAPDHHTSAQISF